MGRWALLVLFAAAPAAAAPSELFERWRDAGPDERRHMREEMERTVRARRFVDARPVLVDYEGRTWTLAELFTTLLDPALVLPTQPASDRDAGLTEVHRRALGAFPALRKAYALPRPVRPGTLNLFLAYAHAALEARALTPTARRLFFAEAVRNVRELDGRVAGDARTRFLLHDRLLPKLLALVRSTRDPAESARHAEVASLLYLPGILDDRAEAALAPLASGEQSRAALVRFYRQGTLEAAGTVALARSVAIQIRDDAGFAAGAAPLVLELLADHDLPPADRGALIDAVLAGLAPVPVLAGAARDLAAVGFGGAPRPLEEYVAARAEAREPLPHPEGTERFRFLRVVMVQERSDRPPAVVRIERADVPYYEPLRSGRGAARRFAGLLVPDASGTRPDFLGPPPGVASGRDHRLLRRTLRGERITIRTFGPRREEIELAVVLPDDGTEPVPRRGAGLGHVLALLDARLRLATDAAERAELLDLLVRLRTGAAADLAVRHATSAAGARALLPLAERGHAPAALRLLDHVASLSFTERERAFAAALAGDGADRVKALCKAEAPGVAALAADALLAAGDATGIPVLLQHPNRFARACAAALAVRLTPLAGGLRVVPRHDVDRAALARLARSAFAAEGDSWGRLGRWLALALTDPEKTRLRRRRHKKLYLGRRHVIPSEFAHAYAEAVREGKAEKMWGSLVVFLLDPHDPGAGIEPRDLGPLLDALEARAAEEPLRTTWRDALVALVCVQYGLEMQPEYLDLARARLAKLHGRRPPPAERRKAGLFWPLWAAEAVE